MTAKEAIVILEKQLDKSCAAWCQDSTKLDFEDALYMAITALRAQAEAENKPLTLDELRKMDGAPVWICPLSMKDDEEWDISVGAWALIDIDYELCRTAKGGLAILENCGRTWQAYRCKPKKGTT